MGKLLCDSSPIAETLTTNPSIQPWQQQQQQDPPFPPLSPVQNAPVFDWETVTGLEDQQKRSLQRVCSNGVLWKHPTDTVSAIFELSHGGDVSADGNCLFTASKKALGSEIGAKELRRRTVERFVMDYESEVDLERRRVVDDTVRHLYSPNLNAGWGIHVVQEVKLLAKKSDRQSLDSAIDELVQLGLQREVAAESIYKERCIAVDDGPSWAKYMSISGSPDDEFDIITLQFTEEGLLTVDENRDGRSAAFGDDIAIESLATEFKREIYVVQAHGSDSVIDEDNCVFFLPHRPRGQISKPPFFLFMKGRGWCGAGADHYEPLIVHPAPLISQERAAVVL